MISTTPARCNTVAMIIGSSTAPPEIFRSRQSRAPAAAMARVSAKGSGATANSAARDGPAGEAGATPRSRRETNDAEQTTSATRRYCMKATRRISAPYSSAMAIIAEAAPGEQPQAAVVPGSVPALTISQPTMPPAMTVLVTTSSIVGQSRTIEVRIDGVSVRAIRQPMIACAPIRLQRGERKLEPPTPNVIAAIIGPSMSAPGRAAHSRTAVSSSEAISRASQRRLLEEIGMGRPGQGADCSLRPSWRPPWRCRTAAI